MGTEGNATVAEVTAVTRHDQLWKALLHRFLGEFLALFFPDTASKLDLGNVEFLNTEEFTDLPTGERRAVDVLARVGVVGGDPELVLIHTEVEADFRSDFDERMYEYYSLLSLRHRQPVLPVALFLRGGSVGAGVSTYKRGLLGIPVLRFSYLTVSLSQLRAEDYVDSTNPLAPATMALMEAAEWNASERRVRCLHQVSRNAPDEAGKSLLADCIGTYLPISPDEESEVARMAEVAQVPPFKMSDLTWSGRLTLEAEIRALARLLRRRFGDGVPSEGDLRSRLSTLEEVEDLIDRATEAGSLEELGLAGV